MRYINENPTQTERVMFEKYGLYLVRKDKNSYRYVPVHLKEGYKYLPYIDVEDDEIEWEHEIVFDMLSETVRLNDIYDYMGIDLIYARMKELNFK